MAKNARSIVPASPVPLLDGPYQYRSAIAGARRCVNLYPEINPPNSQAPVQVTHHLTPGLDLMTTVSAPTVGQYHRLGMYLATNGELFVAISGKVYYVDSDFEFTEVGTILNSVEPLSWADNGLALVIVNGTSTGYSINLSDHSFGTIGTGYYAANKVAYIDTFFVFNRADTNQFYISLSNATHAMLTGGTAFDSLDIAGKTGAPDDIDAIIALEGELWLLGSLTSEVWAGSGNAEFAFERIPGALIEHGIAARHSVAKTDKAIYFLSKDVSGKAIVVRSNGYSLEKISPHAMDEAIQAYSAGVADAFGYCRQQDGHAFYVLHFPTADKTWAIELATGQVHEWESMDANGDEHRHRGNCYVSAYGYNLVGDFENPNLYALSPTTYTDNGTPILRLRQFPHMIGAANRRIYDAFIADLGCGQITDPAATPLVTLRWSDDRGKTWKSGRTRSMGLTGENDVWPKWTRLGMARDRVFELSWAVDAPTKLNGAYLSSRDMAT